MRKRDRRPRRVVKAGGLEATAWRLQRKFPVRIEWNDLAAVRMKEWRDCEDGDKNDQVAEVHGLKMKAVAAKAAARVRTYCTPSPRWPS
jgi:hypothetical protein